jgi:PAS domain S-box-containing protein
MSQRDPHPTPLPPDLLRAAFDQASTPILISDAIGRIAYANDAAARLLDVPLASLQGRHFASLMGDSQLRPDIERIAGEVAAGRTWTGALSGRPLTGGPRKVELRLSPIRLGSAGVSHSIAFLRDIVAESELAHTLAATIAEQAAVGAALAGLDPGQPLGALAEHVASALLGLDGVTGSRVIALGARDQAEVLADRSDDAMLPHQLRLPASRTRHLLARAAEGAWVEAWVARREYGRYGRELRAAGIRAVGYAPLRHAGRPVGVLAVATVDPRGATVLERHLTALAHFGVLASALLGPALAARQHDADLRAEIERVIETRAFVTVFQPVVRLDSTEPIGYEALTRFADGTAPERRFADAEVIGLGVELETATLLRAVDAARSLPQGRSLSLNVSPRLVTQDRLGALIDRAPAPTVFEVTEREPIEDYGAFREAMHRVQSAKWAVDDAGAGHASLRHIIELRPDFVKLDRHLVSGIAGDPIRQALVAGMLHFAASIGVQIVAEGIETQAERLTLQALGVEFGQGYLFGRPEALR